MQQIASTIALGSADCGHFEIATRKEWLVTNGLGGYAAGTVSGANTRRYHGLLVAAFQPPLKRILLVAKVDAAAIYAGETYSLFANEFADAVSPHGYRYIETFQLEGLIPVWTYVLADARLEQRVWMRPGSNTTYVTYTLAQATAPLALELTPLCTYRDYHSHSHGQWQWQVEAVAGGFVSTAFTGAQPYRVVVDRGEFHFSQDWYWNFKHRVESYRGLDDLEDLFVPGHFKATLQPGETLTLICSTEALEPHRGREILDQERRRQINLLAAWPPDEPAWVGHLVLAADQFIVQRTLTLEGEGEIENESPNGSQPGPTTAGASIIAGYPWFGDWGRDTMIALPGLTLTTHRPEIAAVILRTFARHVSQGMLPNRFPDAGEPAEYNTVDAALWYFQAIYQYLLHTADLSLIEELYPTLEDMIGWHQRGTRYNIRADANDGLLFAGQAGIQLTWMDAKIGNWVVTPRIGKPVEVNALWYNALQVMAALAERLGQPKAARQYREQAGTVAANFRRRFWFNEGGYLYDVIDGPEGASGPDGERYDARLRPNQIFAVSLPFQLLAAEQAKAVVDACARRLWTPHGLRTLAPYEAGYEGRYGGTPYQRDEAYHQGTVWSWLLGPFALAHYRVYGDAPLARAFLKGVGFHLMDACLGSISEIFDGDPPYTPRGCFAQAWSVSEVLRAWREIKP